MCLLLLPYGLFNELNLFLCKYNADSLLSLFVANNGRTLVPSTYTGIILRFDFIQEHIASYYPNIPQPSITATNGGPEPTFILYQSIIHLSTHLTELLTYNGPDYGELLQCFQLQKEGLYE